MKKDLNDTNNSFDKFYIAKEIKAMLDKAKTQVMQQDWDRVYIIDGGEGSGKSLLALQLGYYLDPTLTLDQVTFSGKDFSKAIGNAKKGQCIIFDEAFNGLSSTGALSKMNKLIVRKLMECRQKNLFLIIVLPTIFLLQKYVAIFRSKALFHVYVTKKGVRGYYRVYNQSHKKGLYLLGKKFYSYAKPYVKNSFVFRGKYPVDEEEYRAKKFKALVTDEEEETKRDVYAFRFALLCKLLKEKYNLNYSDTLRYLGDNNERTDPAVVSRLIAKLPQKPQKLTIDE